MIRKPNLILLHGALGSSNSFQSLIPELEKDFNLIVPDLRWHGTRTEEGSGFKMNDLVNDLDEIFQKNNLVNAHVFGFSMGGYVAISLALKRPELFNKIMTLGTKLDWKPEQAQKEINMLNPEKIQEKVPQFAQHLKSQHGEHWSELCRQTADMMLNLANHPILKTNTIDELEAQIRLGLGDQDHMVSLDETITFFKALQNGELQVFPKTGHPIEKVDTKFLAQSIKDFISRG